MDADERVFVMGEDVGRGSGPFGITGDLYDRYGPTRVRDTPLSEIAIAGAGFGAALNGLKPVIEYHFCDLLPIIASQIFNGIGPFTYLSGGRTPVPLVIRCPVFGFPGHGNTHSKTLWGIFLQCPGIKVVAPSNPYDAKGMLLAAIADPNPVLFFEHVDLFNTKGVVPPSAYIAPLNGAAIRREGSDITVAGISVMVHRALQAATALAREGIQAEVIDMRSISPMDTTLVEQSLRKTGRLLVLDDGPIQGGCSAELLARIFEAMDLGVLKTLPRRLATPMVSSPASKALGPPLLISPQKIQDTIKQMVV
jgi:pyruvate/2-oxoglutarate/acetoin dehydrogenase E1 component